MQADGMDSVINPISITDEAHGKVAPKVSFFGQNNSFSEPDGDEEMGGEHGERSDY